MATIRRSGMDNVFVYRENLDVEYKIVLPKVQTFCKDHGLFIDVDATLRGGFKYLFKFYNTNNILAMTIHSSDIFDVNFEQKILNIIKTFFDIKEE